MRLRPSFSLRLIALLIVGAIAAVSGVATRSTTTSTSTATTTTTTSYTKVREPADARETDADVATANARAASTGTVSVNSGWAAGVPLKMPSGANTDCGASWSGNADSAGRVYHGCGYKIQIRDAKGAIIAQYDPGETYNGTRVPIGRRDVAPSPDGTYIYYSVGDRLDTGFTQAQLNAGWGSIHRLKKTSTGYTRDTTFSVGPVNPETGALQKSSDGWGTRYLAVGADGTVFTTSNAFLLAYSPTGSLVGVYGGYGATGAASGFDVMEGVAANRAGTYIYATEQSHQYIARFAKNSAGKWVPDKVVGTRDRVASCVAGENLFASPYDIGTDGAGNVYIADTTCGRILQYDANLAYRLTVLSITNCNLCFKPHGLAISNTGSVILPWYNQVFAKK